MANRWGTGRLEAFSDGVFAIAITLLVLDLAVPASAFDHLWRGIGAQWPSYLAYVTSFVTIGGLWMAHQGIFRRLQSADATVMRLNLVLLMVVSFLPFPTGLMAKAIESTTAERAAVIFYGLTLLVISVVLRLIWQAIIRQPDLLKPGVSAEELKAMTATATPNIGFYAVAIVSALLLPKLAVLGYLVVAVVAVWRTHGDQPPRVDRRFRAGQAGPPKGRHRL